MRKLLITKLSSNEAQHRLDWQISQRWNSRKLKSITVGVLKVVNFAETANNKFMIVEDLHERDAIPVFMMMSESFKLRLNHRIITDGESYSFIQREGDGIVSLITPYFVISKAAVGDAIKRYVNCMTKV